MVLDVTVPDELWGQMTDFGLRVRDAAGGMLSDAPLDYATDRRTVVLEAAQRGHPLAIGLRPAFTRAPGAAWRATVRVTFLRADPVPLALSGGATRAQLTLRAGQTVALEFAPPAPPAPPAAPAAPDTSATPAPAVPPAPAPAAGAIGPRSDNPLRGYDNRADKSRHAYSKSRCAAASSGRSR